MVVLLDPLHPLDTSTLILFHPPLPLFPSSFFFLAPRALALRRCSAWLPVDDLLLSGGPHTESKRGMSKEKEDEGGKTATAVDNQWIKAAVQGQGEDAGTVGWRCAKGAMAGNREEMAALMLISFGCGVLSARRLRHAQVERWEKGLFFWKPSLGWRFTRGPSETRRLHPPTVRIRAAARRDPTAEKTGWENDRIEHVGEKKNRAEINFPTWHEPLWHKSKHRPN